MIKFVKTNLHYLLVVAYIVLCGSIGSTPAAPMFIKSWKLFDSWAVRGGSYFDIAYDIEVKGEMHKSYALRNAMYLQSQGVDTVRLTNLLLRQFDYQDYDFDEALSDFKAKCNCENPRLVKKSGAVSDHVLYLLESSDEEIVREL